MILVIDYCSVGSVTRFPTPTFSEGNTGLFTNMESFLLGCAVVNVERLFALQYHDSFILTLILISYHLLTCK